MKSGTKRTREEIWGRAKQKGFLLRDCVSTIHMIRMFFIEIVLL